VNVHPYQPADAEQWDAFCAAAPQATLLHTRRFLSYHGERFRDLSLIVKDDEAKWLAVLPAAELPSDPTVVCSHPGVTYGGLVTAPSVYGERFVEALTAIVAHYRERGYQRLTYKPVPYIYHRLPMQEDLYALSRIGAVRYRCDLTSSIDLQNRGAISSRRKRSHKKAVSAGVTIATGPELAAPLWNVLEENLTRKHGVRPVHSLEEIQLLSERFPNEIRFTAAILAGQVIAGIVLFDTPVVSHSQYIASSETGYDVGALDMVFEAAIEHAAATKRRYFDFGISNEDQGRILNQSLYGFKHEFGSGGAVHEFYEARLDADMQSRAA